MTRSVRLSRKGQFVIPKEMRDALGVKEGDELLVVLEGHVGPDAQGDRPLPGARAPLVALRTGRLVSELARYTRVGIDRSVLIYHLEDTRPYADLTEGVLSAVARGTPEAVVSTISVAELLVKPWADDRPERVAAFQRFIISLPSSTLVSPDGPAANEAARLRARYGIGLPEALLVASARRHGAQAFVTNDDARRKLWTERLAIIMLDDYV